MALTREVGYYMILCCIRVLGLGIKSENLKTTIFAAFLLIEIISSWGTLSLAQSEVQMILKDVSFSSSVSFGAESKGYRSVRDELLTTLDIVVRLSCAYR
jgi:hypothetical protein